MIPFEPYHHRHQSNDVNSHETDGKNAREKKRNNIIHLAKFSVDGVLIRFKAPAYRI